MNILVTNDDGIHAPGLVTLARVLAGQHDVTVVAPDRERSAIGHAITLQRPLRAHAADNGAGPGFAVNGTPADCVKLAVLELLDQPPDLVVSGINPGPNVGVNLNYSGTVGAAREGALLGLPAVAVSLGDAASRDFEPAARFTLDLAQKLREHQLPRGVFLNVNFPAAGFEKARGVRVCSQGSARLEEAFHKREDPRSRTYYWQGSQTQLFGDDPKEDGVAIREGYIALTPVRCDMTEHALLETLEDWKLKHP